jgi:hypothetical protein
MSIYKTGIFLYKFWFNSNDVCCWLFGFVIGFDLGGILLNEKIIDNQKIFV